MCNALYGFVPPIKTNIAELSERRMFAKDMALKPADSTRIRSFNTVQSLAGCMAKCPGRLDCEAVMYDMTSSECTLYNTSVGTVALEDGQKAIAVIWSTENYNQRGKYSWCGRVITCQTYLTKFNIIKMPMLYVVTISDK
jgi:hypothetical protein